MTTELFVVSYTICGPATSWKHEGSTCSLEEAYVILHYWSGMWRRVEVDRQWRDADGLWDGQTIYAETRERERGGAEPVLR